MERSIQKTALVNLIVLVAVATAVYVTAYHTKSYAGLLTTVYLAASTILAFTSWIYLKLLEREALERLEYEEMTAAKASGTLFEPTEADQLPAHRARVSFGRFLIPAITVIFTVGLGAAAWFYYTKLGKAIVRPISNPSLGMSMYGLFALVLFLLGRFSITLSKLQSDIVIRPVAAHMLVGAYINFATGAGIAAVEAGYPETDLLLAKIITIFLALLAVENLINMILEIYRPRVHGIPTRLLYDSRLVGLLAQPENLFTAAAHALDYQFGFKVSETWVFKLFKQYFGPLTAGQLLLIMLSTCFVVIEPGQQGVLERFGKLVQNRNVLNPGIHLKLPWPIDRVHRFTTEEIQRFDIGYTPDPQTEKLKTIVWGTKHANEQPYLVADREARRFTHETETDSRTKPTPPVSMLTVNIPVYYQITNVLDWFYNHNAPSNLLESIASRVITHSMVSVDLARIMSTERLTISQKLREEIQAAVNQYGLGVKILFAGIQGIHPPVEVAPEYEKVVAAAQRRKAKILDATASAIQTNALAEAAAFTSTNQAVADALKLRITWVAQAALFTNQIPAYLASPIVYTQRLYFKTFAQALSTPRKYILLTTNFEDVIVFDLQDKIREDLLQLTVPPPSK